MVVEHRANRGDELLGKPDHPATPFLRTEGSAVGPDPGGIDDLGADDALQLQHQVDHRVSRIAQHLLGGPVVERLPSPGKPRGALEVADEVAHVVLQPQGYECVDQGHPRHAIRVSKGEAAPDQSAPVVQHQGDVVQVQLLDQECLEVVDVLVQEIGAVRGSAGLAESHVVGDDDTALPGERRDEPPAQIAPGRLAVKEDDGRPCTCVDEVHREGAAVAEVRREGPRPVEVVVCP